MRHKLSFYRKAGGRGGLGQGVGGELLCVTRAEIKYKPVQESVASSAGQFPVAMVLRVRQQSALVGLSAADWFLDRGGQRHNIKSVQPLDLVREIEITAEVDNGSG